MSEEELPAGDLSSWLEEVGSAIAGRTTAQVPCGDCTACCRSAQFVHIGPDEADTLAHVPKALRFPAPGLPKGHVLLGYDERGRCPMLTDHGCSIYAHRPRTCRTYDCRIFPAAGLDAADDGKPLIAERARRWRFTEAGPAERATHDAIRETAARLATLPADLRPVTVTQRAVLAVELHDAPDLVGELRRRRRRG